MTDDLEYVKSRIKMLEDRVDYYRSELLTVAGRAINTEEENKDLRRHISDLVADIPKSPRECYRCGSCDVVAQWFIQGRTRSPGLGHQPSRLIVWYCAKHEPRKQSVTNDG